MQSSSTRRAGGGGGASQAIFHLKPLLVDTIEGRKGYAAGPEANGLTLPELLEVRLRPSEKQAFTEAADMAGPPLSAWLTERLRCVARQGLKDLGRLNPFLP